MFGFFKRKKDKNKYFIDLEEEKWIKDNLSWIDQNIEKKNYNQIPLNSFDYNLFQDSLDSYITQLIDFLKNQFGLNQLDFEIEWIENPYKTGEIEIEVEGDVFEREVEKFDNKFKIYLSEDLKESVRRLTFDLILCFVEIYYIEKEMDEYLTTEDKNSFLLLSAVYFGFGVILSHGLMIVVANHEDTWIERRIFEQYIPFEMFSCILAFMTIHYKLDDNQWENDLNKLIKGCYDEFKKRLKSENHNFGDVTLDNG